MATLPYPCTAAPLTSNGVQNAINALGIDAPTLWAIVQVETVGCGFLGSWRPQILFERHIFSRLTNGVWDATASDVSNPVAGGYGARGDAQYARLAKAYQLNAGDPADLTAPSPTRTAALQSTSWGLGQVMGENAGIAGYGAVQDMISKMCGTEDAQLQAMVQFILTKNLAAALQQQDWATYAYHYNGANYQENQYDVKLANAYTLYQDSSKIPDISVRTGQLLLLLLGFNPSGIDGSLGAHTLTALHNFQSQNGIPLSLGIDDGVIASLTAALPAAVNLLLQ